MHDEEGSEGIEESTGTLEKTPATDGVDETKRIKMKRDKSDDLMGSVPRALPEDPAKLAAWVEKEKARLEKKKQQTKKAA